VNNGRRWRVLATGSAHTHMCEQRVRRCEQRTALARFEPLVARFEPLVTHLATSGSPPSSLANLPSPSPLLSSHSPPLTHTHPSPADEHIYTNGDICLSLLGTGWRPSLTGAGLCLAIQSMMASARKKEIPRDNSNNVGRTPGQSQLDWIYHDDTC